MKKLLITGGLLGIMIFPALAVPAHAQVINQDNAILIEKLEAQLSILQQLLQLVLQLNAQMTAENQSQKTAISQAIQQPQTIVDQPVSVSSAPVITVSPAVCKVQASDGTLRIVLPVMVTGTWKSGVTRIYNDDHSVDGGAAIKESSKDGSPFKEDVGIGFAADLKAETSRYAELKDNPYYNHVPFHYQVTLTDKNKAILAQQSGDIMLPNCN